MDTTAVYIPAGPGETKEAKQVRPSQPPWEDWDLQIQQNLRRRRRRWWKLCKNNYSQARATFDTDWDDLIAYIKQNGATTKLNKNREKWLVDLKSLAPQWAACYTWKHKPYGIHSTQRSEATNSAIATFAERHQPS